MMKNYNYKVSLTALIYGMSTGCLIVVYWLQKAKETRLQQRDISSSFLFLNDFTDL